MPEVVIVASAFGAEAIRRDGHQNWLKAAADAGATGFEVRRELFATDDDATPRALGALADALDAHGLWSVYSTPDALYHADGSLDEAALDRALAEARTLGARYVKLQLGGFAGRAYGEAIVARTAGAAVRLVVENGQLKQGGTLAQFTGLFGALRDEGHPGALGMTFDIGNWQWPGEAPLDAARALAPQVEYIHCKAVRGSGARLFAVAPDADDPVCAAVLPLLPRNVPRGIEFPFDSTRVAADAARYVAWLAAA